MKTNDNNSVQFAKALADTTRQKIMDMLCCNEMNVSQVAAEANIKQPTATHHLSLLKELKLVTVRVDGKNSFYTLNQERFVKCCGRLIDKFAPDTQITIIQKE